MSAAKPAKYYNKSEENYCLKIQNLNRKMIDFPEQADLIRDEMRVALDDYRRIRNISQADFFQGSYRGSRYD